MGEESKAEKLFKLMDKDGDGYVTKNGHKVVIHSRSPSVTSRSTDV